MDSEPSPPHPTKAAEFGRIHVVQPQAEHFHTVVLLHGRGSTGDEFADDLFTSNLSSGSSLRDEFPGCRWVFPLVEVCLEQHLFQEDMPAWFEAPSLADMTAGQDLQAPGIRDSVVNARARGLCAFVGAGTWLPFAADIEAILTKRPTRSSAQAASGHLRDFVEEMVGPLRRGVYQTERACPLLKTPVFIGHGSDDAYVDMELGKEAADVLSLIKFSVEWKSYCGAEQEGHWLKVPEQVDDIRAFLAGAMTNGR